MHAIRLALTAALLLPTAPVPQQPALPTIKVDTKLTVVDVTVSDKDGRPVHGLTQADFTIKEDGKPQPIKNFDEYGTRIPPAQIAPQLPPGLYTNQPKPAATTAATNIILLSQLEKPSQLMYAKQQAQRYLKTFPEGTRVAIYVLQDGVRIVQDVTTDRDVLVAAIDSVMYQSVLGATFNGIMPGCFVANAQSQLTLSALNQISASVSGIPGRKNLIWFTHGIPWLTNYAYFKSALKIDCIDDNTDKLHATYSALSAARMAIYPVDPSGLLGLPDVLNRESIQDLADASGGIPYFNRNDLDAAVGEAVTTGSDYYTVAYVPPLKGYDGNYHSIDVKVNRPGLKLQFRRGYTSLDLAKLNNSIAQGKAGAKTQAATVDLPPAISQFRAGMAHGAAPSSELLLAASIKPVSTPSQPAQLPIKGDLNPKVKAHPLIRYNVIYSLPAGQLALADNPDGTHKASVEFDVIAYGEDGTKLSVIRQTANVTLKPEEAADFNKKPFEVPLQFDLPPGKLFVRVGALDVLSGKAGTLEVPQTVAKP